jgi:RNA polymerase sigma-70 factor (ECF subfamily)
MSENDLRIKELVRTRLPDFVLFARQWNSSTAEDIVQEAFLKLMRQKDFPENPVAWLFTVIRNASNNERRSQQRRKKREEAVQYAKPWFESPRLEETAETDRLIRELESLDFEFREIIVAKIWGKLSFEQIAELLGSSRTSVHRKYTEGLARLFEKLNSYFQICNRSEPRRKKAEKIGELSTAS